MNVQQVKEAFDGFLRNPDLKMIRLYLYHKAEISQLQLLSFIAFYYEHVVLNPSSKK